MTCPNCQATIPANSKFCPNCGTQLQTVAATIACPKCGTQNTADSKFCTNCGTTLTG